MTSTRLRLLAGVGLAAAGALVVALFLVWQGGDREAAADTPHAGLDFYIGVDANGDTTDDCDTSANTGAIGSKCTFPVMGSDFKVAVYLANNGGVAYDGYDATLNYDGVTALGTADGTPPAPGTWPGCVFFADVYPAGNAIIGCATDNPPGPSTYTGSMARVDFSCDGSGTVQLVHGEGSTDLVEGDVVHAEAASGEEILQVNCESSVTNTPTQTHTSTPTVPTNTPTQTRTPTATVPTNTATQTRTPTQPPAYENGDVNGSQSINSLDALLILQFSGGLLTMDQIDNFGDPDCNKNGPVDSVDALLTLQVDAGFLDRCPS